MFAVTSDLKMITMSSSCDLVTKKTCYDLDATPHGDMLFAGNRGFDICDQNGKVVRSVPTKEGDFTSIQYYKGKIYTLLKEPKGSNKRRVVVFDATTYQETSRWELPDYGYVSMLAVSNDKVYAVDSDAKKVKIYSLTGNPKSDFHHSGFKNPGYMCACPPDGVLIADWSAGVVYKVECSTDKIVWEWKVTTPRGVYCDKLGNVWTWSSKEKAYFLRSSDGRFVIASVRVVKHLHPHLHNVC